jgi:hypothetical protein
VSLANRVATTVTLAACLLSPVARADEPTSQADALFEEARTLMLQGRHVEACPKLEESERLDPAVGTLLHLGECFAKTGRTASAWRTFREAIARARTEGHRDREEVAATRAQNLEPELARLQVSVPVGHALPGLTLRENGVALPESSWGAAIPVDPGPHVIEASAPGHLPWRTQAAVNEPGRTLVVAVPALELEAAEPDAGASGAGADGERAPSAGPRPLEPSATSSAIAPTPRNRTWGWVTLAAGSAVTAVGAGFGVAAIRSWADSRSACVGHVCSDAGVRAADDARASARVSTGLFVVGALGVAAGVYLLVRPAATPKPAAAFWLAPTPTPTSLGVQFGGVL